MQTLHSTSERQLRTEMIYYIDRDLSDAYTNTSSACVSCEFVTKNASELRDTIVVWPHGITIVYP